MPFVLFFIVLGAAIAVAVLYPHLRAQAGIVVVLLGGLLAYVVLDRTLGGEPAPLIVRDDLRIEEIVLEEGPRFAKIAGRVTNGAAEARLREFRLSVTLRDCPEADAPPESCDIIAEDEGVARVDVPPGQTRRFEAVLGFSDRPEIRGVPVWDYTVSGIRGTDTDRP